MAYFECLLSQSSGGGGAVLTVTCDSALSGATISCTDGTTTLTAVCPSSSPYEVEFNISNSGTWTISGLTYTASVEVNLDYEVELGGFNYRAWLTAGGLDPSDYASLSAVLADEKAIRQLFLVHASVDYLASVTASDASVETIIEDNYCAKWINESDYALFTLYDNSVIADLMDEADKYFYGEWGIVDSTTTPPTWGAKGNIPIMTSNTAPYGEASAVGSHSSQPAYMAFDGTTSTQGTMGNAVNNYFRYRFVNPVKAKKARVAIGDTNKYVIKASNDGTTWDTISEEFTGTGGTSYFDVPLTANTYYLQYELVETVKLTSASYTSLQELQFYGHTLKVSVPTMTSNTAPYGEASASSVLNSNYPAWKAFDNNSATAWSSGATSNSWVRYDFVSPVAINFVIFETYLSGGTNPEIKNFKIQASNDGNTWKDLYTGLQPTGQDKNAISFNNISAYKSCRLFGIDTYSSSISIEELQFYGLDYSEKEFEPNTNKKWLYDHGVELETMTGSGSGITRKDDNCLYCEVSTASTGATFNSPNINLNNYGILRVKMGNILFAGSNATSYGQVRIQSGDTVVASKEYLVTGKDYPENEFLDISSVNQTCTIRPLTVNGSSAINRKITFAELWLE